MKKCGWMIFAATMASSQMLLGSEIVKTETAFGFVNKFTVDEVDYQANIYTATGATWSLSVPKGVDEIEYLVVAGGGSGGNYSTTGGGGGGAGGLLSGMIAVEAGDAFLITIGAGGAAGANNGKDSTLLKNGAELAKAVGGGCGGSGRGGNGAKGGSGGGSGGMTSTGAGACTEGQGNKGGQANTTGGSGGGGAGAAGDPSLNSNGANGGAGFESPISGEPCWYAGGGGGGCYVNGSTAGGEGGSGIGGDGGTREGKVGFDGVDGTGSGGGGGSMSDGTSGGKGGNGVVILRFKAMSGATSLLGATVSLTVASEVYDGLQKTPRLDSIKLAGGTVLPASDLTLGVDYEIVPAMVGPDAGTYTLTVNGLGDYCDSAAVQFSITQAENALSGAFTQSDWEWGCEPAKPTGSLSATYGEVVYRYYDDAACSGAPFVPAWKTPPGRYYVRGEVDETSEYRGIVSMPQAFSVGSTYKPVPKQKVDETFGFSRRMSIAGRPYCANAYTNTESEWSFVVPSGVRQIEYLAVGGGGGGGVFKDTGGGGGGAGGYVTNVLSVKRGVVLTLRVGRGGTLANGCDTVILTNGIEVARAYGGGFGSCKGQAAGSGGSGGGVGGMSTGIAAGRGVDGQGHNGGQGAQPCGGSGGGGAGSAGANTTANSGADGGEGIENFITGVSQWYAGGGGGGMYSNGGVTGGRGGSGVGGDGGTREGKVGFDGVDGTGSGGGGGSMSDKTVGGRGGSGIIVLRHRASAGLVISVR